MSEAEHSADFIELPKDAASADRITDWELVKRMLKVALPLYPAQFMGMCLGLVSTALVGQLGDRNALAAVGLSNVMTNILGFSWLWGLSGAISTLAAQDWGAQAYKSIGTTLQRGILILLCFADLPLIIAWANSEHIMISLSQPPAVAAYVGQYTRIRIPGIVCQTITCCLYRALASIGNTRIALKSSVVQGVANIMLNVHLIPRLGFVGAPLTATTCDVLGAIMGCYLAFQDADFRKCWPGWDKGAWTKWLPFLRISLPSFILLASEAWVWNFQDFLAGWISTVAMATQAITPSITCLLYCTGSCLNAGGGTVMGNLLGEGRTKEARRAAQLSMCLLQMLLFPQVVLLFALQTQIPYLFTKDEAVIGTIVALLPFTMVFSICDSQQAGITGIICAVGKQAMAAPLVVISYWVIAVPLGYILAFGKFGFKPHGLFGLWYGMLVGVFCHLFSFIVAWLLLDWESIVKGVQERQRQEGGKKSGTPMPVAPLTPCSPNAPSGLLRSVSGTLNVAD